MREYQTKKIDSFDYFFVFIALGLIALEREHFAPLLGSSILKLLTIVNFDWSGLYAKISEQSFVVRWIEFLILADFLGYWAHRILHSRLAWRFHSFHHSPSALNWLSGVRTTPMHVVIILTPTVFCQFIFLKDAQFWPLFCFSVFDILNQHLCHSNVKIPYEKQLEKVLVTPRMHFVHHHPLEKHTNQNYGLYFSVWDRLFGTYIDADDVTEKGLVGLDYEESKWSAFLGLDRRQSA